MGIFHEKKDEIHESKITTFPLFPSKLVWVRSTEQKQCEREVLIGHSLESDPQGTTAVFDKPSTEADTNTSQAYTRETKIPELYGGYCL